MDKKRARVEARLSRFRWAGDGSTWSRVSTVLNHLERAETRVLSVKEVSDRLGVSRRTIYNWVEAGTFPQPVKMGDSWKGRMGFLEVDVNRWIDVQRE